MGESEIKRFLLLIVVILSILTAGILIFIIQYRKRRLLYEKEKQMINEQHSKELLAAQLEIQQQTMQYIGREIHDNVGQKLTLAALYAQQIDYEQQYPEISERIAAMSNIINESLSELRSLSKNLTSDHIAETDLIALIQQECSKANATAFCAVNFKTNIQKLQASYTVKNILIRIIQEFMQNSLKHAACTAVSISLEYTKEGLNISAGDNGKGFDTAQAGNEGIGLNNMKKRAAIIGAVINMQSKAAEGTIMQMFIPAEKIN